MGRLVSWLLLVVACVLPLSAVAQQGLELARKIYPPGHPFIPTSLSALTEVLASEERYPEAIASQEEAIGILRSKRNGGEQLGYEMSILANLYDQAGRTEEAIARGGEALAMYQADLGPDNYRNGEVMANLARYHMERGRSGVADSLFRDALDVFDRVDDQSILTPLAQRDYGNLCFDLGRDAPAESLFVLALARLDSTNVGTRGFHGDCLMGRARVAARKNQAAAAESLMAAGFRLRRGDLAETEGELLDSWLCWVSVRWLLGDEPGAIEKLRGAVRSGATNEDVSRYPELALMRTRPDYPLDNSP